MFGVVHLKNVKRIQSWFKLTKSLFDCRNFMQLFLKVLEVLRRKKDISVVTQN